MNALKNLTDRLMHSRRRSEAVEMLHQPLRPGSVLFMCYGNICRSPFAEALFRRECMDGVHGAPVRPIRSAGFTGADRSPPPEAIAAATKLGVDISRHRSTVITADVYRTAALVVTMSPDQSRELQARFGVGGEKMLVLADLDPKPIDSRTIRDPWRCTPDVYDASYARIDRCIRELVDVLDGTP